MSQNIPCFTDIQNFINDFNTWINGADNANVVLHDSYTMPSYRRFAREELYRPGVAWISTVNYLKDDIISYGSNIYLALSNNINVLPTNTTYWRKVETGAIKEGIGISSFISFLSNSKTILTTKNIESFSYIGGSSFSISVPDAFATSYLVYSIGFSYENFDLDNIARYQNYVLTGRQISNNGKTLEIEINPILVNDLRIDICFFKV